MTLEQTSKQTSSTRMGRIFASRETQIFFIILAGIAIASASIWWIFRPAGASTFTASTTAAVGTNPYDIASGDFDNVNGDDAVTANYGSTSITVTLRQGSSPYYSTSRQYSFATSLAPSSVCVADFNADGLDDIAVGETNTSSLSQVEIFLSNGLDVNSDLQLAPGVTYSASATAGAGYGMVDVACGDINGDGDPDVVAGVLHSGLVLVYTNTGTGALNAGVQIYNHNAAGNVGASGQGGAKDVKISDIDGDGYNDIAIANGEYGHSATFIRNVSNTSWSVATGITVGFASPYNYSHWPNQLLMADVTGDGKPDFVTMFDYALPSSGEMYLKYWPNTSTAGSISFGSQVSLMMGNFSAYSLIDHDFDGDTDKDVVITLYNAGIRYYKNGGSGSFSLASSASSSTYILGLTTVDVNGDGDTDVVGADYNNNQLIVFDNNTVPVLSSISPTYAVKGSAPVITANGSNFTSNSVSRLQFEGSDRTSTFVSDTQITGQLTSSDTASVGTFNVSVFNGAPGGGSSANQTFTVIPAVYFSSSTSSANEGVATQADFTISLSDVLGSDVDVNYTLSGTADNASDYSWSLSGTATITAGQLFTQVSLPLTDDLMDENDETIIMTLTSVVGTSAGVLTGQDVHTFTILDDDPPPSVSFQNATEWAAEGNTNNAYVVLSDVSGKTVTVNYSYSDITATSGTDYTPASGSVVFNPGVQAVSIDTLMKHDLAYDDAETFTMTLNSADWALLGAQTSTTVTIYDVAPPEVSFSYTTPGGSEGSVASLTFYLNQFFSEDVEVYYTLNDVSATSGVDYTAPSGTIVIPAYNQYAYENISLTADAGYDPDETFTVTITGADLATVGSADTATVTITDDHPAIFGQNQVIGENMSPGSQTQQVSVELNFAYAAENITADITASGGTAVNGVDYTFTNPTPVTITAGQTYATFNVTTIDNSTDDTARAIEFTISNCNCSISGATFLVTIQDDEPYITVTGESYNGTYNYYGVNRNEFDANAGTTIEFTIPSPAAENVNISYSTIERAHGAASQASMWNDFGYSSGTATILAGNTSTTIDLTIYDDWVDDPAIEIYDIDLSTSDGRFASGSTYNLPTDSKSVTVEITDNDPSAQFSGNASSVVETVGTSSIAIQLSQAAAGTQTVDFSLAGTATYTSDFTISGTDVTYNSGTNTGTVTFNASEDVKWIDVSIVNDGTPDAGETIIFDIDAYSGGQIGYPSQYIMTIEEPGVQFTATTASNLESTTSFYATVELNTSYAFDSYVTFSLSGTATYGGANDYTVNSTYYVTYDSNTNTGTLTIPAYSQTGDIYFTVVNNAVAEADETIIVTLDSYDQGVIRTNSTYTYTIQNDDSNRISFSPTSASGAESVSSYNANVQLDLADNSQDTTFSVTIGGTAASGVDFNASAGPYTITQGTTSTSIPLTIIDDLFDENNETVTLTLTGISGNVVGGSTSFTYTITDDDAAYAKIFLDSGYSIEADTSSNKITAGDTLYLELQDVRFNQSAGSVDSISSGASVVSSGGDTESVTLTETSADSSTFRGTINTALGSVSSDGTLQVAAGNTVNLVISAASSSVLDDISTYTSRATNPGALTSSSNGLSAYWMASGAASANPTLEGIGGDQYVQSISSSGDMYVSRLKSTAASTGYSFSSSSLMFDIAITNTSYATDTWTLSGQTFTGLNVLIADNALCYYYYPVPDSISTNVLSRTTVTVPRSSFLQSTVVSSSPCSMNWSDIRSTFFIVPSVGVNTVAVDNLELDSTVNIQSNDASVVGGATPVTLNAATNITTTGMDLSWSQNVDVDFASYKVYYATHATVTASDTLATTITNAATTSFSLSGLSPTTTYYIRVLTTNTAEASAWSNEITATTETPPPSCNDDGRVCVMDSGYSTSPTSIAVAETLYVQASVAVGNSNSGAVDTLSVTITSEDATNVVRDTESLSLTETGANTGIFQGSIATASTDSSGVLYVAAGDTITASYGTVSTTEFEDFESWIDTADMTDSNSAPYWQGLAGSPLTLGPTESQTGGNDYLNMAISSGNTMGDVAFRAGTSAINFGSDSLTFQITTDNDAAISHSTTLGTQTTFNGFSVMLFNQGGEAAIAEATAQLGTCPVGGSSYCSIPQASFTQQFNESGTPAPLLTNWSTVVNVYFVFATSDGVTGNAVNIQMDNIGHGASSLITDSTAVTGSSSSAASISVTATIPPTISYSLDSSLCNLGTLSDSALSVCSFNVTVSTNADGGYVAYVQSQNNGVLTDSGGNQISAAGGQTLSAGTAGWGIGTSDSGLGSVGDEIVTTGTCSPASSPSVRGLSSGQYTLARTTAPADARVTSVCVGAAISQTTPAGSYSDTILITVVGNF